MTPIRTPDADYLALGPSEEEAALGWLHNVLSAPLHTNDWHTVAEDCPTLDDAKRAAH